MTVCFHGWRSCAYCWPHGRPRLARPTRHCAACGRRRGKTPDDRCVVCASRGYRPLRLTGVA